MPDPNAPQGQQAPAQPQAQTQAPQGQVTPEARQVAGELHAAIQQQGQANAPAGAAAAPGGLMGGLLTSALLSQLKGVGQEELAALVEFIKGRLAARLGGA